MTVSTANAVWNGTLKEGSGTMKLGSEPAVFPFTFASRFEDGKETNPEELIGAAQAGCFSITNLSNHYNIRVLSHDMSQGIRKVQADLRLHLYLVYAL